MYFLFNQTCNINNLLFIDQLSNYKDKHIWNGCKNHVSNLRIIFLICKSQIILNGCLIEQTYYHLYIIN